jgi:hypothetical protein
MGSFNTTCFVSQQTISTGDETVIIPIIQQSTYKPVDLLIETRDGIQEVSKYGYCSSTCYPTAFWGYAGPLIKGKYDDYGRFELTKTEENAQNLYSFLNSLVDKICDVKQGENSSHDIPLNFKELYNPKEKQTFESLVKAWDKLWELSHESRLFITNYKGEPTSLAFAVMHQVTADYLIEELSKGKTWDNESLEPKAYFNTYVNKRLAETLEIFSDKKELQDTMAFAAIGMSNLEGFRLGEQEGSRISLYYRKGRALSQQFLDYFKNNPEQTSMPQEVTDELFKHVKEQIEHRYLATAISSYDLKLTPMVYAGQDYQNQMGNAYLKMVGEVNKRVNKLVKDKYGEDEEYDDDEPEVEPTNKPKM